MSTLSRVVVAAVLCVLLCGCGRLSGSSETKTTLGTHPLTIVDSSEKPFGGTSGRRQNDPAEYQSNPGFKVSRVPPVYRTASLPPGSVNVAALRLAIEDVIRPTVGARERSGSPCPR